MSNVIDLSTESLVRDLKILNDRLSQLEEDLKNRNLILDSINNSLLGIYKNTSKHQISFKDELIDRCNDHYPIQIVLNSGIIINCLTDDIFFYEDHFQIPKTSGECDVKIKYPANISTDFFDRGIWIPYHAISLVTDHAS